MPIEEYTLNVQLQKEQGTVTVKGKCHNLSDAEKTKAYAERYFAGEPQIKIWIDETIIHHVYTPEQSWDTFWDDVVDKMKTLEKEISDE